nr:hypothetical protein [Tanacetum cinerariifolium]
DEVARIISWAVDAARLDPSSSDVDQDDESDDDPDDVDRPFKEHFDIIPYVFRVGVVIDEGVYVFWQPLE